MGHTGLGTTILEQGRLAQYTAWPEHPMSLSHPHPKPRFMFCQETGPALMCLDQNRALAAARETNGRWGSTGGSKLEAGEQEGETVAGGYRTGRGREGKGRGAQACPQLGFEAVRKGELEWLARRVRDRILRQPSEQWAGPRSHPKGPSS